MADSKIEVLLEMNSRLEGINAAISRMDNAQKKASRLDRAMSSLSRGFSRGAAAVGRFVKVGAFTVAAAGTVFAADSLNKYAEFEARMKGVEAVLKPTTKELGLLEDEARKLGRTTKFSAREAASGLEILAKNGVKTEDILGGVLESSLKLSASVGAELPAAADTLTDALQIFNLAAQDSARVVDSINSVTINSKFGFEDYQAALANGGASAVAAGQDFEDFNTAITATASFFANGETAGTSYKAFLDSFSKDSKKAAAAEKLLGLTLFETNGDFKDLADVAGQLDDAFDRLNPAERAKAFNDLFSKRGKNFAIGLARAGEEGVRSARFLSQFADATAQAEKRLEGTQGSLTRFKSAFEGLQIAIGGPLAKSITPFIDAFSIAISDLTKDAESSEEAISLFFANSILNAAAFLDVIANITEGVRGLVGDFKLGVAVVSGDEAKIERITRENVRRANQERNGDEFTVEALKIVKNAEALVKAREQLADADAQFSDLVKIRRQAGIKGSASEEEITAIEKAVVAQSKIVEEKKDLIDRIKGVNQEEETEAERNLAAKVQLSNAATVAQNEALLAERELRLERGKLALLVQEGRENPDDGNLAAQIEAQREIVTARKEAARAAGESSREIIAAEEEVIENSKITAERFSDLAKAAEVSSDRISEAFKTMNESGSLQLGQLNRKLGEVQDKLKETTEAGEKFQNDATENSWLKDFALDGIKFLSNLVSLGFDPIEKKLSTLTKAGVVAGGLAGSAPADQAPSELSPIGQVAAGESDVSGIARGLLGEEDAIRLRFEEERAVILEESTITANQRNALLLRMEGEHQRDILTLKENEQGQERRVNEQRLAAASDAFGNLSALMQSENKKAFKIGQAAAIAQATMQTYTAATGAYASLASIPYVGPILGAAAAAAAIVAGGVNIANIASQQPPQFFQGGFVGGDNVRPASFDNRLIQAADGEFVVNNRAAQANRELLKAINAGASPLSALRLPQPESRIVPVMPPESGLRRNRESEARPPQVNVLFSEDDMMDRLEQSGRMEAFVENFLAENSTRFGR